MYLSANSVPSQPDRAKSIVPRLQVRLAISTAVTTGGTSPQRLVLAPDSVFRHDRPCRQCIPCPLYSTTVPAPHCTALAQQQFVLCISSWDLVARNITGDQLTARTHRGFLSSPVRIPFTPILPSPIISQWHARHGPYLIAAFCFSVTLVLLCVCDIPLTFWRRI